MSLIQTILDDESGYVALITALISVVVAAGLIQLSASNTKHKIQTSTLEQAVTNTAQLQDAWTTALDKYIQANRDGWSDGYTETVQTPDLQPDFLVNGFGDNGKTPFDQEFVGSIKKSGDTVQAVIVQKGSMDPTVFRDAGMKKTPQSVSGVAYRIQQAFMRNYSSTERVPAVLLGGTTTADGGDLFSVDISDHIASPPSNDRVVTLKNFPGLVASRNNPTLAETLKEGNKAGGTDINLDGQQIRDACYVGIKHYIEDWPGRTSKTTGVYTHFLWSSFAKAIINGEDNPVTDFFARVYLSPNCDDIQSIGVQVHARDTHNRQDYGNKRYTSGGWSSWSKVHVPGHDNPLTDVDLRVYINGDGRIGGEVFVRDTYLRSDYGGEKTTSNGWTSWSGADIKGNDNPIEIVRTRIFLR